VIQAEVKIGGRYLATISNTRTVVRIVDEIDKVKSKYTKGRRTRFEAINLRTGRVIAVTAARLSQTILGNEAGDELTAKLCGPDWKDNDKQG